MGHWLAQLVEHVTLELGVMSLSPTLRVEFAPQNREKKIPPSRIPCLIGEKNKIQCGKGSTRSKIKGLR